jgi:thiaminase
MLSVYQRTGHLVQINRKESVYCYQMWISICLMLSFYERNGHLNQMSRNESVYVYQMWIQNYLNVISLPTQLIVLMP